MASDYEKIRDDNIRRRGEEFDDIGRLISEQLYSDRSQFVYELLQNAEDALERRFRQDSISALPISVQFRLYKNRLEFKHFGQPFDEEDVRAISDVLKGTKAEDRTQIGKFGIGFKSVYAFTSTPEIHSEEEHFIIERYIRPRMADRIPEIKDSETLFIFPFNHEKVSPEEAYNLIATKLKLIGSRVLLFLKRINEIRWSIEGQGSGHYLREQKTRDAARHVVVIGQNIDKEEEEEDWLVFERQVPVVNSSNTVAVEIAFRLELDKKTQEDKIVKVTSSPLVAYFATEKDTRLGFVVQGPYRTTPSRDNIPKDDEWNKKLVKETASLITDSLVKLKDMGFLTVSVLETLPIRTDDFPSYGMFQPIVDSVRDALMEQELLPTEDGMFTSAKNVKLARGSELRKLLSPAQLKELTSSQKEIKWLSGEITQDRTPDLRSYLMNELDVEEITREVFARKISGIFLKNQSDEWIVAFYTYLSGRETLWKKAAHKWQSPGLLRSKPIIRLNDGNQVNPFRPDGSPNAYLPVEKETDLPIVNVKIAENEIARDFLKKLGIPEQDLVAEVFEKILPKYNHNDMGIFLEEHKRDIAKIRLAYLTDSQEKKSRLLKKLKDTPFIYAECSVLLTEAYKRPTEVYFSNHDLLMYFKGNKDAWFVSSKYNEILSSLIKDRFMMSFTKNRFMDFLKELGVAENIRIKRKKENHKGYVVIVSSHGWHERGHNGFDPDIEIDGLEHAIKHPTMEKSLFVWNNLAIPHSGCISGIVESSSRKTYEFGRKNKGTSKFGHLLINSAWLPGSDENFHMPGELSLDDLPESFRPDEKLSKQLEMKKDVMAKLAIEFGISQTTISIAQKLEKQPELLKEFESRLHALSNRPEFPKRTSKDPVRREEHLADDLQAAAEKTYDVRERSVRTTRGGIDPTVWLRSQYTNDSGQMVCQICKQEMPFRKLDGEYYFEKVEIFDRNILPKEHEAQFLALCPLCAAMYKELIKRDKNTLVCLKDDLMIADDLELHIKFGDINASVRFVETHFHDLKVILQES